MRRFIIALALAATIGACGSDGTSLEGVYTIDAWNENTTGCADPGPSIREMQTDTHFYVQNDTFITQDIVIADLCASVDACRMQIDDDSIPLFAFGVYDKGSDDDGWTGRIGAVSELETTCDGVQILTSMRQDATGIVLQHELTDVTYPKSSDPEDPCSFDDLYAAAESAPCTGLEVIHGVFLQEL
jgi:hypothetical protein